MQSTSVGGYVTETVSIAKISYLEKAGLCTGNHSRPAEEPAVNLAALTGAPPCPLTLEDADPALMKPSQRFYFR